MRVSQHFKLGVSQPSLEFLDVDIQDDTRVFVDPHAFRYLRTPWGMECVVLLEDFYDELLAAIRAGDRKRGLALMEYAGESNEVHLGLSVGHSQGSGIGSTLAGDLFDALAKSKAVVTAHARDIEETVLFVEGILHDRLSDMTINVVRSQLIKFTQEMCDKYGMKVTPTVDSGPMWNRHTHTWQSGLVDLPLVPSGKLLLVPRAVVRKRGTFDPKDYLSNFVLEYMVQRELETPSSLLIRHRSPNGAQRGRPYVTKKSLLERERKPAKVINAEVTEEDPSVLARYRLSLRDKSEPLPHDVLAAFTKSPEPDWDALLEAVIVVPTGNAPHADAYHRAVQNLLTALFYPALDLPQREVKIDQGRKRIDIVFTSMAKDGFFCWLREIQNVPSGSIVVECKNYTGTLGNAEFDQITGRLSPQLGQVGLLMYRGYSDDKADVVQHFRDHALHGHGYVIALDDEDLKKLVEMRKTGGTDFAFLMARFRELI